MKRRGLAQNSAFALAGDLAAKAGLLAVLMVAARGMSTPEFAVLATAIATATVLTAVLDLGSQTLLTRDGVAGPEARGHLFAALTVARLPLVAMALLAAGAFGIASRRPIEALATVLIAAAGAAQLSLTGALRSAQDLRPEALAKLAAGVLQLAAAGACVALVPRASVLLVALAVATVLALVPLIAPARRSIRLSGFQRPVSTLRRAAPLGVIAVATLAYYRSGTIALSLLSTPWQTARFAAASTIAWGMLSVGNAVTTGLLPRLAAAASAVERAAVTGRALVWLTALSIVLAGLVALLAQPLMTVVYGAPFARGSGTLALLAGATVLIAPTGVLGTALIADGHLRPVGVQVAASLAVNVLVLAALAPTLGATGAALATLACEGVGLALIVRAGRRISSVEARSLRLPPIPQPVVVRGGR